MKTNINASSLWDSIKTYAMKAGRVAAKPVLHLYFVMTDDETPRSTKLLIGSALAYLVLPINLVSSKKHPGIGWVDEAATIAIVYQKVKKSITPKIEQETEEVLNKWFGETANAADPNR
ncbi:MAG: DUF1232 domain-containing protein [Bacteroidales bacterium]|nr:DUF1232 domain-containing protein [Bacteroidales bacterium]